jgi:hypothetical protein
VSARHSGIRDIPQVQRLTRFQVRYKKNAAGDHVIALIFPVQPP